MLILLPPSEGKTGAAQAAPVDLGVLSMPELTVARERIVTALVTLSSRRDEARSLAILGLSANQRVELLHNVALRRSPARPAGELYTGVLYDALSLPTLGSAARAAAERALLVSSGLWGAVRVSDRIPPYRCSISVTLPRLGPLAAYWRKALAKPMARVAGEHLVIDLRSSAYASTWTPPQAQAQRAVTVRVLEERTVDGATTRSAVSHVNKATKGRLVRDLLLAGAAPDSPAELVEALHELKYRLEQRPADPGKPARLDVIVTNR